MLLHMEYVVLATTVPIAIALPIAMMVLAVLLLLETSCHPYDVLECEPEVVSGYYVDQGGVAFMLVYLGEGLVLLGHQQGISTWSSCG